MKIDRILNPDVWDQYYKLVDHNIDGTDSTNSNCIANFKLTNLNETWKEVGRISVPNDTHQGIAFDGTYYYGVGENSIRKYDSFWNEVSNNLDLINGLDPLINHISAPAYYNGNIYIIAEHNIYPCVEISNATILIIDANTLQRIDKVDISALQGTDESVAIGIDAPNNEFYIPSFCQNVINVYDSSTFSFKRKIIPSYSLLHMQGIAIIDDFLYICCDGYKSIVKLDKLGNLLGAVYNPGNAQPSPYPNTGGGGALEGICVKDDKILLSWFLDSTDNTTEYYVSILSKEIDGSKITYKVGQGGLLTEGFNSVSYKDSSNEDIVDTHEGSIMVWFKPTCAMSPTTNVWDNSSNVNNWECFIGDNNTRYISARAQRDPRVGWVDSALNIIKLGTWYNVVFTWIDGGNAVMYLNGTKIGISPYSLIPAGTFSLGANTIGNLPLVGVFDELRVLTKQLSDEEVLAQYNNQNSPESFYSIEEVTATSPISQSVKIWENGEWVNMCKSC